MPSAPSTPSRRWFMLSLCFTATVINYIDRANLSIAAPEIQRHFGFSKSAMGILLGGFFWTYALMQIPMGRLIDRLGPKKIYAFAVGWWSLFTMATASGRGFGSLLGCRLMLGAGEAGGYPSNAKVTSIWFSARQRGFATSLFDSGSRVGAVLSLPLVSFLVKDLGWRKSFVVTGALGFLWVIAWLLWYRDPTRQEATAIGSMAADAPEPSPRGTRHLGDENGIGAVEPVPGWTALLRYRTVWGMMAGFFCLNFVIYFFITWFPTYLREARGFSLQKTGLLGMIPGICAVLGGWLGGYTSDALFRSGWSLTAARKTCLVGGLLLSSSIALAAYAPSAGQALALLCLSYASLSFAGASIWCLPADVAPSAGYVATLGGIQNFAGSAAGVASPAVIGILLDASKGSFVLPLLIGGIVCIAGAACYLFLMGRLGPLTAPERSSARGA